MALIKLNNKAVSNATAFGSISSLGSMTFIKKLTASSSATLSFVDGTDGVDFSIYKEYVFTYNNIHGSQDNAFFQVGFRDGGSDYDAPKTTSHFKAQHSEDNTYASVDYQADGDLAQSTDFQQLTRNSGNDNDQSVSGYLHLFNPSSTTFVKHFIGRGSSYQFENLNMDSFVAGYCNTTTAIDGVQFKFSGGTIDVGDICLYGIA
jgi:hypothetical protein